MKFDILAVMSSLAKKRPIFHSEADFQFALAWELKAYNTNTGIRLEYNAKIDEIQTYIDIWITDQRHRVAVELKYKQAATSVEFDGEEFTLSNHLAPDTNCFLVVHDIYRVERLVNSGRITEGYCIFVTNDKNYWNRPSRETNYDTFRVNEGAVLSGERMWRNPEKKTAQKYTNQFGNISLSGNYNMKWRDYHNFGIRNGEFRYLVVEIP